MFLSSLRTVTTITIATLLLAASVFAQQNPREIFERARMLDESNQNLSEAIKLYGQVVSQANEQRALAARAQFRIGILYERLGRKAEAQKAFQSVVAQHSDQTDILRQARLRIPKPTVRARTNAAGTNGSANAFSIRQVWTSEGVYAAKGISADGRYLSFTDWSTGDLAVRDLHADTSRHLTNKPRTSQEYADLSTVCSDGKDAIVQWDNGETFDLRIVSLDGSKLRVFHQEPKFSYYYPLACSPDKEFVVTSFSRKDGSNQIARVSIRDGSVRILKTFEGHYPESLTVSPDSHWILYDRPKEDVKENEIFVIAADGSRVVPLVQHPANDSDPVWAQDGKSVLLLSDRGGSPGLWQMRVNDGQPEGSPQLIKANVGEITPLGMTEKGSLYYSIRSSQNNVYVADLDPATAHLTSTPQFASHRFIGFNSVPTWSPDGESLAYVVRRPGSYDQSAIVIRSFKNDVERELTSRAWFGFELAWSPDGRTLLASGRDYKGSLIRFFTPLIDTQTGKTNLVVEAGSTCSEGCAPKGWFPDGKSIYFKRPVLSENKDKLIAIRIMRRDLESGEEKEIFRFRSDEFDGRNFATLSPDGRQFGAWSMDKKGNNKAIVLISTDTGARRELLRADADASSPQAVPGTPVGLAWTPDSRYVIFGKRVARDQSTELWRVDVESGKPEKIGTVANSVHDIVVNPKGNRIAYSTRESKNEVWVMENFLSAARPKNTISRR